MNCFQILHSIGYIQSYINFSHVTFMLNNQRKDMELIAEFFLNNLCIIWEYRYFQFLNVIQLVIWWQSWGILFHFEVQWNPVKQNTDKPNYCLNRAKLRCDGLCFLYKSFRINRKSVEPNSFCRSRGVRFNEVLLNIHTLISQCTNYPMAKRRYIISIWSTNIPWTISADRYGCTVEAFEPFTNKFKELIAISCVASEIKALTLWISNAPSTP